MKRVVFFIICIVNVLCIKAQSHKSEYGWSFTPHNNINVLQVFVNFNNDWLKAIDNDEWTIKYWQVINSIVYDSIRSKYAEGITQKSLNVKGNKIIIPISDLEKGTYLVSIRTSDGNHTKKIVKE